MANGFPVGLASAAAAARVGAAAAGVVLSPAAIAAILVGVAAGTALAAFADWWFKPVYNPFTGTWFDSDGNPLLSPLGGGDMEMESTFDKNFIDIPGAGDAAFIEIPNAYDEFPFTVEEVKILETYPLWVGATQNDWVQKLTAQGWTVTDFACGPDTYTSGPCIIAQLATACASTGYSPCSTLAAAAPVLPTTNGIGIWFMRPTTFRKIKGQAIRNPGTEGVPWFTGIQFPPYAVYGPRAPVAIDGGDFLGEGVFNPPSFASAFDLPIKNPGQVVSPPRIFPVPGVRPVAPVNPAFPGSSSPPMDLPVVVPGVGDIGVQNPPLVEIIIPTIPGVGTVVVTPVPPGTNPRPPEGKRKEVKLKGKAAAGIKFIANQVTEFRDFVRALWKALPKERRRCKRRCTLQQMIADLARNTDYMWGNEAWVKEALVQVISNEIQDNFYGRGGRAFRDAAQKLRDQGLWGDVKGFQTGEGYRPKPKQTETPFDLEVNVRRLVNLIW